MAEISAPDLDSQEQCAMGYLSGLRARQPELVGLRLGTIPQHNHKRCDIGIRIWREPLRIDYRYRVNSLYTAALRFLHTLRIPPSCPLFYV